MQNQVFASPEGRERALAILNKGIAEAQKDTTAVINRILTEVPQDSIVRADKLRFSHHDAADRSIVMWCGSEKGDARWTLHEHALRQIADRGEIPFAFVETLRVGEDWQRELLIDNLDRIYGHSGKRHLVRAVNGQARGFLSDKYRRLDARPIMEAFVEVAQSVGALPYQGVATDVRMHLKAILPELVEMPDGEIVALGVEYSNSDYGSGSLEVRSFVERVWCLNGARTSDAMRKIHLGGRLDDDIAFSQRTYELDTKTMVSAVKDVVRTLLGQSRREALVEAVRKARAQGIEWKALSSRPAKVLTKEELRKAQEAFEGPDVQNLPAGQTMWRASNALSWIAKTATSAGRRMDLEAEAGRLLAA